MLFGSLFRVLVEIRKLWTMRENCCRAEHCFLFHRRVTVVSLYQLCLVLFVPADASSGTYIEELRGVGRHGSVHFNMARLPTQPERTCYLSHGYSVSRLFAPKFAPSHTKHGACTVFGTYPTMKPMVFPFKRRVSGLRPCVRGRHSVK